MTNREEIKLRLSALTKEQLIEDVLALEDKVRTQNYLDTKNLKPIYRFDSVTDMDRLKRELSLANKQARKCVSYYIDKRGSKEPNIETLLNFIVKW